MTNYYCSQSIDTCNAFLLNWSYIIDLKITSNVILLLNYYVIDFQIIDKRIHKLTYPIQWKGLFYTVIGFVFSEHFLLIKMIKVKVKFSCKRFYWMNCIQGLKACNIIISKCRIETAKKPRLIFHLYDQAVNLSGPLQRSPSFVSSVLNCIKTNSYVTIVPAT